jgi:hypothetical protein
VDKLSEGGKRAPLLVIGEVPFAPPGAFSLSPADAACFPDINNFYIIASLPDPELEPFLASLARAGAAADQVLVLSATGGEPRASVASGHGTLELFEGEGPEEFRSRLLARVEAQRQKKLPNAFREAQENGIARRLGDQELARALDVTRVAHALACGYGLSPAAHGRVLQACLAGAARPPAAPWPGDVPAETLIPEAAAVFVDAVLKGFSGREAVRERAAVLSFRCRTDLLHQVESCLGGVPGGKHAA